MPPTTQDIIVTPENSIEQLRKAVSDVLTPLYDTQFNMLRWLQSNDFNVAKSAHVLRKHLKWRRERNLDGDASGLQSSKVSAEYAPLSIVGLNREDGDRLIVVDLAGRIDVGGVMKSVQPTEYLHQMYRNFEKIHKMLLEMEARVGHQCYVHYIFDLEELSFDPMLLGVVNGPFRVSWQLVASHYREFIDKFIVINSNSYINVLWAALSPFIPESSRDKIVFAGKEWKEDLLILCDKDHLPQRYGGTIPDEKALRDPRPVPKELYWKPRTDYPGMNELHRVSVPAGKDRVLDYSVKANTTILIYSHNESDLTFTLYYSQKQESAEKDWEVMVPSIPKCGMPAMDCFDYFCEETGYYHLKLSNGAAWLLPSTYRVIVTDKQGNEIEAANKKEKWIKLGTKLKK